MNSLQIDRLLRHNKITKSTYIGVFPSDQLTTITLRPSEKIIINICPAAITDGDICHWVCVARSPRGGSLDYFDSSGLPTYKFDLHLRDFVEKHGVRVVYNNVTIQSDKSIRCGEFCLVYVFFKCFGYSLKKIVNFYYKRNLEKNDSIVKKLFKKIFK